MMSGPFFDPDVENTTSSSHRRNTRDDDLSDWGANAPVDVGKRGKKKAKARMGKRAREAEENDDDGWFDKARRNDNDEAQSRRNGRTASSKKMSFNLSVNGDSRFSGPPPPMEYHRAQPSLLDRLGDAHNRPYSEPRFDGVPTGPRNSGGTHHRSRSDERYEGVPTGPKNMGRKSQSEHHRPGGGGHSQGRRKGQERRETEGGWNRERDREHDKRYRQQQGPRYRGGYSR